MRLKRDLTPADTNELKRIYGVDWLKHIDVFQDPCGHNFSEPRHTAESAPQKKPVTETDLLAAFIVCPRTDRRIKIHHIFTDEELDSIDDESRINILLHQKLCKI